VQQQYETFGNYVLLEKLASGGMAEVYLAKKIAASGVQKFVAVKRILSQFSDSKDFIQMFKDEAKIAINLSHSNVVSIYDFGIQTNQFYIVMEFVEGRNLRQFLNRMSKTGKSFNISQIVHMMAQISAGLDHAHRCIDPTTGQPLNIIHRDMSPQNVMLNFEGFAKIVDFGIAKAETQIESTRAGTLKGKFGYMSPEQVEGQIIDSRTDLFAIGIMIWEMLADQRLFLANNEINTLRKIRECNIPSLRNINPNIPTELDQIVQKALKKDKSQRYQTCAELHRDLQGFLSRFEPDFSVQDFSSFIKGLYSEDIIEIRKKQIMYSQVNVATTTPDFGDHTEIVTETHSEIIDGLSFDDMSLNTITKHTKNLKSESPAAAANSNVKRPQPSISGNSVDFSRAVLEDTDKPPSGGSRPPSRSREARKSQGYQNPYAHMQRKNSGDSTLILTLLTLSLAFGAFAYINKYEPRLQSRICVLLSQYKLCKMKTRVPASVPKEKLIINTDPQGANVFINGEKKGRSPFTVEKISPPFKVGVRYVGYRVQKTEIESLPKSKTVDLVLERIPTGFVKVQSVGGEVLIEGLKVEKNEQVAVPAGEDVIITVINPLNGRTKTHTFSVEKNQSKNITISPPAGN